MGRPTALSRALLALARAHDFREAAQTWESVGCAVCVDDEPDFLAIAWCFSSKRMMCRRDESVVSHSEKMCELGGLRPRDCRCSSKVPGGENGPQSFDGGQGFGGVEAANHAQRLETSFDKGPDQGYVASGLMGESDGISLQCVQTRKQRCGAEVDTVRPAFLRSHTTQMASGLIEAWTERAFWFARAL